jgi:hypothetical protein
VVLNDYVMPSEEVEVDSGEAIEPDDPASEELLTYVDGISNNHQFHLKIH